MGRGLNARSSPHALISGASIAGVATAFWLSRIGWRVTLLERAPEFRRGGQNVDIRGTGREVLDRMGLTDAVREHNTTEVGTRFVDADGQPAGEFPAHPPSEQDGADGLTAELEILRGDLAELIAGELPETVEWIFGETITSIDDRSVALAGDRMIEADLVVVAEGVRSRTRQLIFGDEPELHPLDVCIAYGTIPRQPDDDHWWRWYTATGGRQATLRPDNHGTIRATLAFHAEPTALDQAERPELIAGLRNRFDGAGWQVPRILDGFAASDDLYVDDLTQVMAPSYARGRVVLTGDAAWCVTPIGGGGATLALVGAYVLAAELSNLESPDDPLDDLGPALAAYEAWMRPLTEEVQDLPPGVPRLAYPETGLGVAAFRGITKLLSTRPARRLTSALTTGPKAAAELPDLRE